MHPGTGSIDDLRRYAILRLMTKRGFVTAIYADRRAPIYRASSASIRLG